MVSRTGYTGEDGFEVYASADEIGLVWDALLEAGKEDGLIPAGLGARDTLRFEACLPLYGHEISSEITPLEAGLSMFVKLDAGDFIGRDALAKQKSEGIPRKLVGFELDKGIAREGSIVLKDNKEIGFVTTGYHSPTLSKSIGLALVERSYGDMGAEFDIQVRKKVRNAKIISKRFYKKNYKK
jgi:aminomethyltransferase